MNSRLSAGVGAALALVVSGAALQTLVAPVWAGLRQHEPAFEFETMRQAGGQAVVLALLGGLRTVMADAAWLRMHLFWEQRNWPATETLLRAARAIDPRPLYFWLNGARIMAYDIPVWRIAAGRSGWAMPVAGQNRIQREQAAAALALLAEAMKFHPASSELWIERANIELNRLGDPAAAAESYRRAWEMPHAPYFAARLHAQLLRRTGRVPEALVWLIRLHPALPPDDPAAGAGVVLERIRELESELSVPVEKSYQAAVH